MKLTKVQKQEVDEAIVNFYAALKQLNKVITPSTFKWAVDTCNRNMAVNTAEDELAQNITGVVDDLTQGELWAPNCPFEGNYETWKDA